MGRYLKTIITAGVSAANALLWVIVIACLIGHLSGCGQPPAQDITINAGNATSSSDNTQDNSVDNSQDNDTTTTAAPAATDGAAQ